MWPDTPELRLDYIKQRHSEIIAEAARNRLVGRRPPTDDERRFTGLRIQVGRMLIMVGQMSSDWALSPSGGPSDRPPKKSARI
jgi:hypothetical protein